MNEFDKGWFNSFSSFYDDMGSISSAICERCCINVLKGAGVTPEEIDVVSKSDVITDECKYFLNKIKNEI